MLTDTTGEKFTPQVERLLHLLTADHLHVVDTTYGTITGVEEALLHQLEQSVGSSPAGAGTRPGKAGGSVINVGSTLLIQSFHLELIEISKECSPNIIGMGLISAIQGKTLKLPAKLHLFVTGWWRGEQSARWVEPMLERWVDEIRNHLDPPKRPVPLRGVPCPGCQATHHVTTTDEGATMSPALQYHYIQGDVVCQPCGHTFDPRQFKGFAYPTDDV